MDSINARIIDQVKHYFGDRNLPIDPFMQRIMKEDDGWFTLDRMLKFHKLARITCNKETILNALENSTLMEISADRQKIRRRPDRPI